MECKTCGNEVTADSAICPSCAGAAKTVVNQQKLNGLCVAGFVLGIVSLVSFLWGVPAILAVVLGAVGIKNAKARAEKGIALGKWGIGLGIFSLCALVVVLVFHILDFAAR